MVGASGLSPGIRIAWLIPRFHVALQKKAGKSHPRQKHADRLSSTLTGRMTFPKSDACSSIEPIQLRGITS